jgi:hypothetical protein
MRSGNRSLKNIQPAFTARDRKRKENIPVRNIKIKR